MAQSTALGSLASSMRTPRDWSAWPPPLPSAKRPTTIISVPTWSSQTFQGYRNIYIYIYAYIYIYILGFFPVMENQMKKNMQNDMETLGPVING